MSDPNLKRSSVGSQSGTTGVGSSSPDNNNKNKNKNNNNSSANTNRRKGITCGRFGFIILPLGFLLYGALYYGYQIEMMNLANMIELSAFESPTVDDGIAAAAAKSTSTSTATSTTTGAFEYQQKQPTRTRRKAKIDEPLNVVIFYADDWTMKVLGKSNPDVQTPNIDEMADNGVLFTENCVTTSICWISRASFFTGTYASRHLQVKLQDCAKIFETHPWGETLFPLLKRKGYYTGLVGKWHGPHSEEEFDQAFDVRKLYYGWHWKTDAKGVRRHVTDRNGEDALHFLRNRPVGKKFALKVSFFATHAVDGHYPSYEPQHRSMYKLYQNVTIPVPKTATDAHWQNLPSFLRTNHNEGRKRWLKRFEPGYYQDNIKDLYRMATEVDMVVGDVIDELKEQGVYDNTLLIFTTDNGNLQGEHGLAEKWYPFEESIRVPLVIQDPRMEPETYGMVSDAMTLNIDLAPTILGAAQIPASSFMQGRDMSDLYLHHKHKDGTSPSSSRRTSTDTNNTSTSSSFIPWREQFFYEYNMGDDQITASDHPGKGWIDASFALVTKDWKYIYWPQHDYEQLFHRRMDPYDEHDLLSKPDQEDHFHHNNHTIIQSTDEIYTSLKQRYEHVKQWVQSGKPAV